MSADLPPPVSPRRIIVCLDGTWNNTYMMRRRDDGHAVLKPSNVLKLARAVVPRDPVEDREQIVYYDVGVGSLTRYPGIANRALALVDRVVGGGWGAGFERNMEDALSFLVLNYEPGDEVFIFGFSRGAAIAQGVARFIDWAGGLPVKLDAYYLPRLFREYIAARGQESREVVLDLINGQRAAERRPLPPLAPFKPVSIALLGVWDTVLALGSRVRAHGARTSTRSRSFHVGSEPPACVLHARHALAIDEVRVDFRPELWTGPASAAQTLEQRWFAGVHSNVGGGYVDDGLANIPFHWMVDQAATLGLVTDTAFVRKYRPYAQDRLYRSESLAYRLVDLSRWRRGRGRRSLVGASPAAGYSLDRTVVWRMEADPTKQNPKRPGGLEFPDLRTRYRPQNVLDYLAAQRDLDAFLGGLDVDPDRISADVRRRVTEIRDRQPGPTQSL